MSTKGKRMANNSDNKKNINSEELYDNANSENYKYGAYERNKEREEEFNERKKKKMIKNIFNNTTYTFYNCCRAWSGWLYICKW